MTSPTIRIEPVTNVSELPELARLFDLAMRTDAFHTFSERYGGQSAYDDTLAKLTESLNDPNAYVFRAVLQEADKKTGAVTDVVVGGTQWYIGYLHIPKHDPFQQQPSESADSKEIASPSSLALGDKTEGQANLNDVKTDDNATSPKPSIEFEELGRKLRNTYIKSIRGKKHVYLRRVFVHPDHQRKGIGEKLLNWGVDIADKQKLVGWLFARPAGSRMYEKAGWKAVMTTEINVPDLDVAPVVSMLREPKPLNSDTSPERH